jgi:methylmalonyl-CoA/ethylmalonyl-CoA epimerase
VLKRLDHVGVIVDNLAEACRFLGDLGMKHHRDLELPGRLKSSFYSCGETQVEVIEISEPEERALRLGSRKARIEHIAMEVDDLATTIKMLAALGVRMQSPEPVRNGSNLNIWTDAETSDGVMYQLFEKQ